MWWCCVKTLNDAAGCKFSKHVSKEDEDDMDDEDIMDITDADDDDFDDEDDDDHNDIDSDDDEDLLEETVKETNAEPSLNMQLFGTDNPSSLTINN